MGMAEQFKNWKKRLNEQFVKKDETPEFTGQNAKIKDHWPTFVAYKKSEKAKNMSQTNKLNAAKKLYHHVTGQVATRLPGLCVTKLRTTCLLKGLNQRH